MIIIQIKTDNAAFDADEYGTEISRILRRIIRTIDGSTRTIAQQHLPLHIKDINGNHVCNVYTTEKE